MQSLVPDWKIFRRVPIAFIMVRSGSANLLTHLWIRDGNFGREHTGLPWNRGNA
jgi:hypothetical protein